MFRSPRFIERLAQRTETLFIPETSLTNVEEFLTEFPQGGVDMPLYLVGSGWSVQFLTRTRRSHMDIEIVKLGRMPQGFNDFTKYLVDTSTPDNYPGNIMLDPDFLVEHAIPTRTKVRQDEGVDVLVVHPGITLVEKLLLAIEGQSRIKDRLDLSNLKKLLETGQYPEMRNVMNHCILGIDLERARRLRDALAKL